VWEFLEHVHVPGARGRSFEFNFFWVGLKTLEYVDANFVASNLGSGLQT